MEKINILQKENYYWRDEKFPLLAHFIVKLE